MAVGQNTVDSEVAPTRKRRSWFRLERAVFVVVIAGLVAYQFGLFGGSRRACVIAVDGHPVTVVKSERTANRLLADLKANADNPKEAQFSQRITLLSVSAEDNHAVSEVEALKALSSKLTLVVAGAGIYLNGKLFVGLPSRQDAVDALSLVLRDLSPPDPDLTRAFREQVRVQETQVPVAKFVESPSKVLDLVHKAMESRGTYTVKGGDSAWKIANDHGTTIQLLKRVNRGVDFAHIREGDTLALPGGRPPFTVIAWKEVTRPVGDPSRNLTQTVRIMYENGSKIQEDVIRRPPRRDASADRTRRSSRRYRRPRSDTTRDATGSARSSGEERSSRPRRASRRQVQPQKTEDATDTDLGF